VLHLIRPAVAVPVEVYTPERKAQLLLTNAVDARDYRAARRTVRKMGLEGVKKSAKPLPDGRGSATAGERA
jgi:hypothetical protein